MKTLLALTLAAAATIATAAPLPQSEVERIADRCVMEMIAGTCGALANPYEECIGLKGAPLKSCAEAIDNRSRILVGFGRVRNVDYLAVRGSGDLRMCRAAAEACSLNADNPRCWVSRSLWGGAQPFVSPISAEQARAMWQANP